jgi:3-hydroxybutyrate dehydrogenase
VTVDLDLSGRRAVVTGAASGIGAACARRLAAAGADLVLVDRDGDGVDAVAEELAATAYVANLAEPGWADDIDPAVDIVVNNAGLQHVAPVQDFSPDMFATVLRVLLEAPFRLVHHVLPHMYAEGWGRIVNISSIHGQRASPYKAAYVAAKHGLEGLSKVIALEAGPHGVTSNTIAPAYVRTPLVARQVAAQAAIHAISEAEVLDTVMLARPVVKRLIDPAEVAELAMFLCSPAADFVTGACFPIDGGWMAQ